MIAKAQATKSASKLTEEEERDAIFNKHMDSIENGSLILNNHIANLHGMKSSQQGRKKSFFLVQCAYG